MDAWMLAHDWFRPRLTALLADAARAGYPRDVAQAVITDLVNGSLIAGEPAPPIDENWARDIGEPVSAAQETPIPNALPPDTQGGDSHPDLPPDIPGQVQI